MDKKKIEKGIKLVMEALGADLKKKDLASTPRRVAKMYEEILAGQFKDASKELEVILEQTHDEIILVKDIPIYSICEHHIIPFMGKAHVAYIPDKKITGLSKIARVVDVLAKKLQVQERLTTEIADIIMKKLKPKGVMVVVEAEHLCYDEETEILTNNGWKFFKDLDKKDKVGQVEMNTRKLSFVKPMKRISYKYKGKMVEIKNLSTNLLVTPDHRVYYTSEWKFYNKKDANKWGISTAGELVGKYIVIPRACDWDGKDYKELKIGRYRLDFEDFVKLFGIWVSEGCVTTAGRRKFFVISQSPKSKHFLSIKNLLEKIGIKYIRCKSGLTTQFRIEDSNFYEFFKKFGKSKDKYIPKIIKDSKPKFLKLFLEWYVKGDGHIKKNKALHLVSKSERLIDDLQEICIKLGIGCTKQNNKSYFRMETHKTKNGENKWYSRLRPCNFSLKNHKGKVYCVSVPTGLILVRRKGRVAVSGNCMTMRGVKKPGTKTVTSVVRGIFRKNQKTRQEALSLIS
jgi:GTP cyclohydrolase I